MQNELHPTAKEMAKDYMKNFWIRPTNKVYTGPLVVQVPIAKILCSRLLILHQHMVVAHNSFMTEHIHSIWSLRWLS